VTRSLGSFLELRNLLDFLPKKNYKKKENNKQRYELELWREMNTNLYPFVCFDKYSRNVLVF